MGNILLDTNVVSELMREVPSAEVLAWFAAQQGASFYVSAITHAEILLGIAMLPVGKRRSQLARIAEQVLAEDFAGRSWPFDETCAQEYALLVAAQRSQGRAISTEDAQIAAIALVRGAPLATRNVKDFVGITGLTVVNPWAAANG